MLIVDIICHVAHLHLGEMKNSQMQPMSLTAQTMMFPVSHLWKVSLIILNPKLLRMLFTFFLLISCSFLLVGRDFSLPGAVV